MAERLTECSFLIPIHPDGIAKSLGHLPSDWLWLKNEIWDRFGGGTSAPGLFSGFYADVDSGQRVSDESRKFYVAVTDEELGKLRGLLIEACEVFQQKCIYLSVGGDVEFVYRLNMLN